MLEEDLINSMHPPTNRAEGERILQNGRNPGTQGRHKEKAYRHSACQLREIAHERAITCPNTKIGRAGQYQGAYQITIERKEGQYARKDQHHERPIIEKDILERFGRIQCIHGPLPHAMVPHDLVQVLQRIHQGQIAHGNA